MGTPQARVGDQHMCNLPAPPSPAPPPPAPIPIGPMGSPTVQVMGQQAARVGDMTMSVPPHPIVKGSMTVMINMMPAARVGDLCTCGGAILPPSAVTVLVGG